MTEDDINRAADAQKALAAFSQGPGLEAARALEDAYARAGRRIAEALAEAALSGQASMRSLAKTALEELARIALARLGDAIGKGRDAPAGVFAGESGDSGAQAPMIVNFHLGAGADADSFQRSKGQIAADLSRALSYGRRKL